MHQEMFLILISIFICKSYASSSNLTRNGIFLAPTESLTTSEPMIISGKDKNVSKVIGAKQNVMNLREPKLVVLPKGKVMKL